jgi:hypothetical protein
MPGWLIFILVALLLLIGVVALLLLLPDTEATEGSAEQTGYTGVPAFQAPPVATQLPPVAAPPGNRPPAIVLRPRPAAEPKLIIGRRPAPPTAAESGPMSVADNGTKMKLGQVKVNLNAICRRTGRRIRACSCERCGKEREQFGI